MSQRTWMWIIGVIVIILAIYFFMGSNTPEVTEAPAAPSETAAPATTEPAAPATTEPAAPATTEPAAPAAPANN